MVRSGEVGSEAEVDDESDALCIYAVLILNVSKSAFFDNSI